MKTIDAAAWVCLLAPLAATAAITLAGERLSRRGAGMLSTLSTIAAFAAAAVAFVVMLTEPVSARAHASTSTGPGSRPAATTSRLTLDSATSSA